jgi:hypothetical protein
MSCITAWPSFLWSPFDCCSVYSNPKVKLMHSSNYTKHYRKQLYCITRKNTTALQLDVFVTGIHRLLVTSKGRSAFPSTKNCQGQLQTLQSLSVAGEPEDCCKQALSIAVSIFVRVIRLPFPEKLRRVIW